ncbi:MAG: EFR1 family ferrodoxin [Actinomycetota bacterium]|nr:EFR1 family ferrodoxin [Actinomycetota bacterium]
MGATDIFYFSGTGNSLFAARGLEQRIPETQLIPIAALVGRESITTSAEAVGLVFPIHGMTLAIPVKRFLKKLDLRGSDYVFAVATRHNTPHDAFAVIDRSLRRQGRSLDAFFTLNMALNDPKLKEWRPLSEEETAELEREALARMDAIAGTVLRRETFREEDAPPYSLEENLSAPMAWIIVRLVALGMFYAEFDGARDYFFSDEKCTGCAICEKVCLSGKIEMRGEGPLWRKDVKCHLCYACLNYCPEQAVQIKSKWWMKSYTEVKGRYSHPYASASEIAAQKRAPAAEPPRA